MSQKSSITDSASEAHVTNDTPGGPTVDLQVDLSVDLAPKNRHHLRLANPVMIASGTLGYDG